MSSRFTTTFALLTAAVLCATSASSHAAFVLIDDLESLTPGNINNQGNWHTPSTQVVVAADPADAANQVLSVSGGSKVVYNSLTTGVANNTTGTLFFQIRLAGTNLNFGYGLSDVAAPGVGGNAAFEARIVGGTSGVLQYDDAGTNENFSPTVNLAANIWYTLWLVADNTTDTARVYIQGGSFATQTELVGLDPLDPLNFKNGTASALNTFLIIPNSSNGSTMFFDNVYVDSAGANLSNPMIPEPASLALAALGSLMMFSRRRWA